MAGALTAAEFRAAAAKFPGLSERGRAVARAVLVEGLGFDHISREHGIGRQHAHQCAKNVYDALRHAGWITASVTLTLRRTGRQCRNLASGTAGRNHGSSTHQSRCRARSAVSSGRP